MSNETEQDRGWKVVKSNDLIQRSRYTLTAQQNKMLLYMVSKVRPMDTGEKAYTFDVREFCQAAGLTVDETGYYYRALKRDIKTIADASAWINDGGKDKLVRWINEAELDIKNGSGTVTIKFHPSIHPYLFDLQQNYTQYPLHEVLPFQSKYSIRLYELLKSYAYGQQFGNYEPIERTFTREELYGLLDAGTYERYNDFKKRALNPAVEEINRYSEEISVTYTEQREGMSVKAIRFTIDHPGHKQLMEARKGKREKFAADPKPKRKGKRAKTTEKSMKVGETTVYYSADLVEPEPEVTAEEQKRTLEDWVRQERAKKEPGYNVRSDATHN